MTNLALVAASLVAAGATMIGPGTTPCAATAPVPEHGAAYYRSAVDRPAQLDELDAPLSASLDEGRISVHLDRDGEDMHITARPDYDPLVMRVLLDQLDDIGIEPMDEDECPADILDDGSVRIYLADWSC